MNLIQNPFNMLGLSSEDSINTIRKRINDNELLSDLHEVNYSGAILLNPRKRLTAEIAWLPGVSEHQATELIQGLKSSSIKLSDPKITNLPSLAKANLLASSLSYVKGESFEVLVDWILHISKSYEDVDIVQVTNFINQSRLKSGFSKVANQLFCSVELENRRQYYIKEIVGLLESMSIQRLCELVTQIVHKATNNGEILTPILVSDIASYYELRIKSVLDMAENTIARFEHKVLKRIPNIQSEDVYLKIKKKHIARINYWYTYVAPIQMNAVSRGETYVSCRRVVEHVKSVSATMLTKYQNLQISRDVINHLKFIFNKSNTIIEELDKFLYELDQWHIFVKYDQLTSDLTDIEKAPTLETYYGCGTVIYGESDKESEFNSYITTLYLVFLWFPIFPIARYRVIDIGDNFYKFLGKSKLRGFDKWHRSFTILFVISNILQFLFD